MESLNKTRAFLTEFIIVILFFSIATVIIIRLYVEADGINDKSLALSKAAMQAQSVSECIRADESLYGQPGIYTEYLDKDMYFVSEDMAEYVQKIVVNSIDEVDNTYGEMYEYNIVIESLKDRNTIYALSLRRYISKEVLQ